MAFECLVRYQHIRESEIAADGCYRWLERIGAGSRYCLGCRFLPHLRSVDATANRVQPNRFCGEACSQFLSRLRHSRALLGDKNEVAITSTTFVQSASCDCVDEAHLATALAAG